MFFDNGSQFLSSNDIVGRDYPECQTGQWFGIFLPVMYARVCDPYDKTKVFAQTNGDYIAEFSALPPYRINKCKRFEGHKVFAYVLIIPLIGVAHGPVGPAMAGPIISQTSALAKCITDIHPSLSSSSSWVRIHY